MATQLPGFGYANPNIPPGMAMTPETIQKLLELQDRIQSEQQARKLRRAMWGLAFVTAWGSFIGSVWAAALIAWPFIGLAVVWLVLSYVLHLGLAPAKK